MVSLSAYLQHDREAEQDIEGRDFLAAVSIALLGTLLLSFQPATVPILEHALPAVLVPQ